MRSETAQSKEMKEGAGDRRATTMRRWREMRSAELWLPPVGNLKEKCEIRNVGEGLAPIIYTHMVSDDIPPLADDMPRFAWMIYKAFALMIYRLWRMKSSHGEGDICRGRRSHCYSVTLEGKRYLIVF